MWFDPFVSTIIISGLDALASYVFERWGKSQEGRDLLAFFSSSCKTLVCEFEITSNIGVYYASTILTFADCLDYESGSNGVSLSDHVFHGLMLTIREHVNLANRMLKE